MSGSDIQTPETMTLVLIRHGESEWNKANLFTGWADVDLSDLGKDEAYNGGRALKDAGYDFDLCYTSVLKRAIHTLDLVLDAMDRVWLPVKKNWHLNERHYGALQGLNKAETAAKYGDDQVKIWRRSFDVRPPALEPGDERDAHSWPAYRNVDPENIPYCECLADTIERVWPWFCKHVEPRMRKGKRILIAAHGNSLRALVKQFDKLTDDEILEVNIPTAVPLVYTFDKDMNVINKEYIGDPEWIAAKIDAVANQGKAKK